MLPLLTIKIKFKHWNFDTIFIIIHPETSMWVSNYLNNEYLLTVFSLNIICIKCAYKNTQ